MAATAMPAYPGFYVLSFLDTGRPADDVDPEDGPPVERRWVRTPIIAWLVDPTLPPGGVQPVTADGTADGTAWANEPKWRWALESPGDSNVRADAPVRAPNGTVYDCAASWALVTRQRLRERRAGKA